MGFPPPPHNGPPPPPEQGGGFGPPPQGFGPPPPADGYGPPPADGYGYPPQGGGYGPPGPPGPPVPPAGYGYPGGGYPGGYPPPQPPRKHTKRNVWIAVGAVAVVGAVVGGIAASGGGSDKPSAKDTPKASTLTTLPTIPTVPMPTFTLPSDFPSLDLPTDFPSSSDEPRPSATSGEEMPYVVVDPGKCFDAPSMTPGISTVRTVSCSSAHDAQAIANKTLSGTFATEDAIEKKAFALCEADATKHAPAGGDYYSYVLFPQLITYQLQGRNTVTCSLTLNDGTNGKKLHSKLS
ncbi:hypothetical protein [Actinacidiphila paucisporea]|uniref:Septum formation-related domain-containing protein n=1 Tax=Actinacidiphila paucisporea TaxID=310782 RepID=A0A1M7DT69_9ACTN|nr:hypothetical protein [Actinacidiphila paucisporea]SHL82704.1 hypothetical protein SAMN05216499_106175 [Actinacidiphila paucisporea]